MRWLKSLVMALAGLIVLALALLGYGFVKRTADPDWRLFSKPAEAPSQPSVLSQPAPAAQVSQAKPWGTINLGLAATCRVTQVVAEDTRMYLTIGPDEACHRVVIIDTVQGRILGTVRPGP